MSIKIKRVRISDPFFKQRKSEMKKNYNVRIAIVTICLCFYSHQAFGSDSSIDRAQLAVFGKKNSRDETLRNRQSLEGKVVFPCETSFSVLSDEAWEKDYNEQQKRVKYCYGE
jgi:hypothetical protein